MTDNRDHPDKLGERLRRARGAAGLTQDQAATAIGVARTTLVAIEKGERRLKMAELVALAELYRVSSASLLQAERADLEMRPQFRRANHPGLSEEAVRRDHAVGAPRHGDGGA
ncbi:MAG: helix-turn-helix transcriptional regulator [Deltaproteobacteria bacterium]|nr:helix-turn-helix transcriptional regulator [Deltaproteobacteria bacterium]